MKAFLKKYWWIFGVLGLVVAGLLVWKYWPTKGAIKRKITFFDLPIISGDSGNAPSTGSGNSPTTTVDDSEINSLVDQAIADYDHA